jgi:hypothetical protein
LQRNAATFKAGATASGRGVFYALPNPFRKHIVLDKGGRRWLNLRSATQKEWTMARLVVNPGTSEAWEVELKPGVNSLGRAAENDVPLMEDSVSTVHCHIFVENGRTVIKDLGSSNGTFLDHSPIQEAVLRPGHKIHVGNLELAYVSDAASPASLAGAAHATAPAVEPLVITAPKDCKIHRQTAAKYYCAKCQGFFCEICVNATPVNGVTRKKCRKCNTDCVPLRIEIPEGPVKGFYAQVPGAFLYPLKGAGVLMLLLGTVMVGALKFAAGMGRMNAVISNGLPVSWWSLMLQVMVVGYMFCYMQNIIHSTALGEKEMPALPDITSFWEDILLPCLQLIGVTLISFAPLLLVGIWLLATDSRASGAVLLSLSVLGSVYFPMAFLAAAMLDTVAAANPLQVVPSILKVPGEYLVALCVLGLVFVARAAGDIALKLAFPKDLFTHSASQLLAMLALGALWSLISFYLLTVGIRILGLLYVNRKETLAWLSH